MNELEFSVEIEAGREKVWDTLWRDETFRAWAGLIDPGTYMVGELKAGSEVAFMSAKNGYGVTSLVEELVANEYLLLRHAADTQNTGREERNNEWTDGAESYKLTEQGGVTTLTVAFNVPPNLEDYFNENYPKALAKVKELSES